MILYKRYVWGVALISVFAVSFLAVLPANAKTFTVDYTDGNPDPISEDADPSDDGSCDADEDGGGECSLREAINAAKADTSEAHTIEIPAGVITLTLTGAEEGVNASGDLDIGTFSNDLVIAGAGIESTVIDGNGSVTSERVMHIVSSTVTIEDVTITGGDTTSATDNHGSGLAVVSSNLTLNNVKLEGHEGAEGEGGALYVSASPAVTLNSVEISNNIINSPNGTDGPAIYVDPGASTAMNFSATDVSIHHNELHITGSSQRSGTVHMRRLSSDDTVLYDRVVFYENEITYNGSDTDRIDLWIEGNDSTTPDINIQNTTFGATTDFEDSQIGILTQGSTVHTVLTHVTFGNDIDATFQNGTHSVETANSIFGGSCSLLFGATLTSNDYNIDSSSGCGLDGDNDLSSENPRFDSDGVDDNAGNLYSLQVQSRSDAVDMIPAAACLDYQSAPLTTDGRGMTRPENTNCDAGAFELDQTDPVVSVVSGSDTIECAVGSWTDAGATASDSFDPTVNSAIATGSVNENEPGEYAITYTATDVDGNDGEQIRTVTVEDTISPVITMNGDAVETLEAGTIHTDDGASVSDTCDESVSITKTGTVDQDTLGEYTITYNAADASGNAATQKSRTVTVSDTIAPTITLSGESTVTITVGDTYNDAGASASDSFEGDLSEDVAVSGSVDTTTPGTYTLTYNVSDSSGNEATAVTRTVTVEAEDTDDEDSNDGVDNNVEDGTGDGSADTEETLGAVVSLTRSTDNMVLVEYADGETKTFQLFAGSAKAKVQLHTNGAVLIAINKTYMRTYDAFTGEKLDQVKLFKNKQYKTKFKRFNVYKKVPGKNNVMVLAQTKKKHKKQFKLRSFVVKNGGAITKRQTRTITLNKNAKFSKLSIAKNKKNGTKARILIKKNGKTLQNWKYRVTKKKGILKKAS